MLKIDYLFIYKLVVNYIYFISRYHGISITDVDPYLNRFLLSPVESVLCALLPEISQPINQPFSLVHFNIFYPKLMKDLCLKVMCTGLLSDWYQQCFFLPITKRKS